MFELIAIVKAALLLPVAVVITYYDVRYRRIPNFMVIATLAGGVIISGLFGGFNGVLASVAGCALAFALMFVLHVVGAMGAGDVKLFAAIGSVVGLALVLQTFVVVTATGGVIAVYSMIRAGTVRSSLHNVLMIFISFLPGWKMPRVTVPIDRRYTVPYGVAITFGSLISLAIFGT